MNYSDNNSKIFNSVCPLMSRRVQWWSGMYGKHSIVSRSVSVCPLASHGLQGLSGCIHCFMNVLIITRESVFLCNRSIIPCKCHFIGL